jgi:hypothetical protein
MSWREREGEEAGERAGAGGPRGPKSKLGRRVGLAVRLDWFFFLFLFFSSFSFQILFKPNSNLLNSNLFHVFKLKF